MAKNFVSPKGQASYPCLTRPDTKFNPEGVFKTGLILSAEEAAPLIEMFKEVFTDEFGTKKKLTQGKFPYTENEDGTVTINAKTKNKPQLVDAQGKLVSANADLKIGGGSVIKIKATAKAYSTGGAVGVTCYLNAVQIIELVEFGGGFSAEEGGFSAADVPEKAPQQKLEDVAEEDVNF